MKLPMIERPQAKVLLGLKLEPLYAEEARLLQEATIPEKGEKGFQPVLTSTDVNTEDPHDRQTSAKVAKAVGLSQRQYERGEGLAWGEFPYMYKANPGFVGRNRKR